MMVKIFVLKNVPTYVNNVQYYVKIFSCRSDLRRPSALQYIFRQLLVLKVIKV